MRIDDDFAKGQDLSYEIFQFQDVFVFFYHLVRSRDQRANEVGSLKLHGLSGSFGITSSISSVISSISSIIKAAAAAAAAAAATSRTSSRSSPSSISGFLDLFQGRLSSDPLFDGFDGFQRSLLFVFAIWKGKSSTLASGMDYQLCDRCISFFDNPVKEPLAFWTSLPELFVGEGGGELMTFQMAIESQ